MAQAVQRLPWLRGKLPVLVVSPAEAFAVRSATSPGGEPWREAGRTLRSLNLIG